MAPTKFILANLRGRMTKKQIVRTIKERRKTEGVACARLCSLSGRRHDPELRAP
jgi:hypothetical protein